MVLTITAKQKNAIELAYLFNKHTDRPQQSVLPFGKAYVFYPENSEKKCSVSLMLDIDPVGLVRRDKKNSGSLPLEQYVNDRPYVCSSFMSTAISKIFGQTMNGKCGQHPELVDIKMKLEAELSVIPCRGGEEILKKLFEPLGYKLTISGHILDPKFEDWGQSQYFTVTLENTITVHEMLTHLYVLIPVLDNRKHYFVSEAEIDKLLAKGKGWIEQHPEKELIAGRYLKHRRSFTSEALRRISETNENVDDTQDENGPVSEKEISIERKLNLNEQRYGTILAVLKSEKADSVLDVGCADGKFLRTIINENCFSRIGGMDVSTRSLEIAADRIKLNDLPKLKKEKISLFQGSLLYIDKRLLGYDALTAIEVIEHLDSSRLSAFERIIFEFTGTRLIIVSTPNREYNAMWEGLEDGKLRHGDHRFEWTREEFKTWAERIAELYNYTTRYLAIGPVNPELGSPTQAVVFIKKEEN